MRRTKRHRARSSYAHVRRKTLYSLSCLSSSLFALTNSCTYPLSADRARHKVPRSLPQKAYACGVVGSTRFLACLKRQLTSARPRKKKLPASLFANQRMLIRSCVAGLLGFYYLLYVSTKSRFLLAPAYRRERLSKTRVHLYSIPARSRRTSPAIIWPKIGGTNDAVPKSLRSARSQSLPILVSTGCSHE